MKNIVITGGSSGVGFAIAKDLSRDNKVIIIGRDETKLVSSVAHLGPNVSSISADLSKRVGIDKAVEKINATFSSVDVLIHSAGIMPQTADENIKNNLLSHYELTVGLNERLNNARVNCQWQSQSNQSRTNMRTANKSVSKGGLGCNT